MMWVEKGDFFKYINTWYILIKSTAFLSDLIMLIERSNLVVLL